ncbi:hypothetical protein PS870_02401 [Pseudomonas fluorescens]|uniref:DUF4376 domain-containing protein n=1 Tax=Pseudomonas fluorescens TaxID=294 RepID=A0A5E7JZY3_PSEFL|nr:hypothetical protein [Pseudomonas fluorescens]VVO92667.1 hypothetical protein PS870_02401 [Pseudomonas fluorescens]
MWARIEDGTVAETTDIDPAGRFHESLIWLPCGVEVDQRWHWNGHTFTPPAEANIEVVHLNRTRDINQQCEATITGGFWSAAIGEQYQYGSQLDDQLNLTGMVLVGKDSLYACRDQQGRKEFRLHTAAQLRQVGDDFTLFKLQLLQKANGLKQTLDAALAAGDLTSVNAVTWTEAQ